MIESYKTDHLFPIPIGIYKRTPKITEDELNFIKNLERIPNASNKHTADTYILQHKELKNLYRFFKECLHHYITQTIAPNQDEVQFYVTQSWANYTKGGEYHQLHKHQNSIVSGVFYPQVEEKDNITFRNFDETSGAQLPLNIQPVVFNRYNSATWKYPVQIGELYLFPGALQHCVETLPKDKETTRISLSFNTWCEGQLGNPKELNSLKLIREKRYDSVE